MRRTIALVIATLVLAATAGPAMSMPVDAVAPPLQTGTQATSPAPIGADTGAKVIVVVLVGAGALLAGAGLGFAGARISRTPRPAPSR